jgi:succinate dehydrogenase/fumarate reductase flavoprotein subunit
MLVGAYYSVGGGALANASVTGTRAGVAAASFAKKTRQPELEKDKKRVLSQSMFEPLERKGGFTPRWVTHMLRNIMIPYYILYVKHEKRLKAALTLVEYLRDYLLPKLLARDAHELRLAHETKNMVLNAEMKLRASLFRTESRGTHYREDYPQRQDPNWLAWVLLKEENGKMKTIKKPIPKEWWPDLSKPYKERYQLRFPGE